MKCFKFYPVIFPVSNNPPTFNRILFTLGFNMRVIHWKIYSNGVASSSPIDTHVDIIHHNSFLPIVQDYVKGIRIYIYNLEVKRKLTFCFFIEVFIFPAQHQHTSPDTWWNTCIVLTQLYTGEARKNKNEKERPLRHQLRIFHL